MAQANTVMTYRQLGTTTSPVVSNLVREDLTSHVKTWPADILAKQVFISTLYIKCIGLINKFNV